MRRHVFILDKNKNKLDTFEDADLIKILSLPKANTLSIELIEITGVESPSSISMSIIRQGKEKRVLQLYKYRTKFLYQNNTFVLDTSSFDFFKISLQDDVLFEMEVVSEKEDFKMKLYCETDQRNSREIEYI